MKLLFDANLSPVLVSRLDDLYPASSHVLDFGIEESDTRVWHYARENNFVIVSKDGDFRERALIIGPPPKVVLVRLGNCKTSIVESLLRQRHKQIAEILEGEDSLLVIP